jgi:hypothetical protein
VLISLLVLVALLIAWILVFLGVGRPLLWEVPAGFRGWASVRYGDPRCPPLETRGVFIVLSASPDGRGCTSSASPRRAWRYTRVEYVHPTGARTRGTLSDGRFFDAPRNKDYLFVGTNQELLDQPGPLRPSSQP